jgi:hypothetical protein
VFCGKVEQRHCSATPEQYEQSLKSKIEELSTTNNKLQQLQQTTTNTMDVGKAFAI